MPSNQKQSASAAEIDRLALQLAKDPHSKVFLPLAEEYCKSGMWQEAAGVLEDGLKYYPGFITAMVVLGRAYDQLGQPTKAKVILEEAVKLSPENLRAHRTLIKIYLTQGLTDGALRSCDVILGLNPRDEEALSVRAKLGKPVSEEPRTVKKTVPSKVVAASGSTDIPETAKTADVPRIDVPPAESLEDRMTAVSPLAMASTIMETTLHADDHKTGDQAAVSVDSPAHIMPPPSSSPTAEKVAQLESWLRSINRERRDRPASEEPSSSSSQ